MQLNPSSWDLGIYTEYVKQAASLRAPVADIRAAGFNLLGDHFQPIVAVIAPFFRVFPSAATLLIVQALLAALSVFPVSQVAREKLGLGPGRAIAVAYGFSWGLQQMANYDFHEIAFAVPLLAFSLSALVRGRHQGRGLVGGSAGLRQGGPGLHGRRHRPLPGIAGIRAAARARPAMPFEADRPTPHPGGPVPVDLGLCLVVPGHRGDHPALQPGHHYAYWSDGGVLAPGGHLTVTGLIGQLFHAWPDKLQTIVVLLLPTAFIALRSPLA